MLERGGKDPLRPPASPVPISSLPFLPLLYKYLFTQFHSCKGKCLQVGVRSSNSWGHSFGEKLLHILAQEGPDLGHHLGERGLVTEAPAFPLQASYSSILRRGRPELKCGRVWQDRRTLFSPSRKTKTRTINPHLIEPLSLFHIWEADLEVEKNGDSGE